MTKYEYNMSLYKSLLMESIRERRMAIKRRLDEASEPSVKSSDAATEEAVSDTTSPDEILDASDISADDAALDAAIKQDDFEDETEDSSESENPDEATKHAFANMRDQIEKSIEQSNSMLDGWANRVQDFLAFLNDPDDENSIKFALDNSIDGSPIKSVKSSITSSIKRVASQLAALEQQIRAEIGATSVNDVMSKGQH